MDVQRTALVLGVTGRQGGATARHLLEKGWCVRGLTRRPTSSKAKALSRQGVALVAGSLEDRGALIAAMDGVQGVFAVTPMDPKGYEAEREALQGELIAEVVRETSVHHLVFSSVEGARRDTGVPHVDVKGHIERRIEALGLRATILRPTILMENLVDPTIGPLYWGLAPAIIGWEKVLTWVASDDVGRAAATAMGDPAAWVGRTVELIGDRSSLGEARRLYRTRLGRGPFRAPMPVWLFRRLVGDELALMWEWQGSVLFGHGSANVGADFPFTSLEQFFDRVRRARGRPR